MLENLYCLMFDSITVLGTLTLYRYCQWVKFHPSLCPTNVEEIVDNLQIHSHCQCDKCVCPQTALLSYPILEILEK